MMILINFFLTILLFLNCLPFVFNQIFKSFDESFITINTRLGKLTGFRENIQNSTINVFYGLPYAKAERFEKASLINEFPNRTYQALQFKSHEDQNDEKYSELFMNIWTPDLKSIIKNQNISNNVCTKKFNVIIYFAGLKNPLFITSSFVNKENLLYSGELFAYKDIIFVSFNYRTGIQSSLYVENKFTGNNLLFDQHIALKFVKDNIKDLCGRDDQLTIMSDNLGAKSLSTHLISTKYSNLIDRAILQSAASFQPKEDFVTRTDLMIYSLLAINKLGCLNLKSTKLKNDHIQTLDDLILNRFFTNSSGQYILNEKQFMNELNNYKLKLNPYSDYDNSLIILIQFLSEYIVNIECLKQLPINKLMNLDFDTRYQFYYDGDFISNDAFINYHFSSRLNANPNVSILIGLISNEKCDLGLKFKDQYYTDEYTTPTIPKNDANEIIYEFKLLKAVDKEEFISQVSEYYTNESEWRLQNGYYESISNFVTDYEINCPVYFHSKFFSKSAKSVFTYYINNVSRKRYLRSLSSLNYLWLTNCNNDDLLYLFGLPFRTPGLFTEPDREFSLKLIDLWSFFAKNGKMKPLSNGKEWKSSNKNDLEPKFVEINNYFNREINIDFKDRCNRIWHPSTSFKIFK